MNLKGEIVDKVVENTSEFALGIIRAYHDSHVSCCRICGGFTRERKEYCTDHCEQAPYVVSIYQKVEQQKTEDKEAANGNPDINAITCQDICVILIDKLLEEEGRGISAEKLALLFNTEQSVIEQYCKLLFSLGKITQRVNKKGRTVYKWVA